MGGLSRTFQFPASRRRGWLSGIPNGIEILFITKTRLSAGLLTITAPSTNRPSYTPFARHSRFLLLLHFRYKDACCPKGRAMPAALTQRRRAPSNENKISDGRARPDEKSCGLALRLSSALPFRLLK